MQSHEVPPKDNGMKIQKYVQASENDMDISMKLFRALSTHQVSAVGVGKHDPDPSTDFAAPPRHEALL